MWPSDYAASAAVNIACLLKYAADQVASKRLQNAKSDKFHGNIHKRGKVGDEPQQEVHDPAWSQSPVPNPAISFFGLSFKVNTYASSSSQC